MEQENNIIYRRYNKFMIINEMATYDKYNVLQAANILNGSNNYTIFGFYKNPYKNYFHSKENQKVFQPIIKRFFQCTQENIMRVVEMFQNNQQVLILVCKGHYKQNIQQYIQQRQYIPEPEAILYLMQFINALKYIDDNNNFVNIFRLQYIYIENNKIIITPISSYFEAIRMEGKNGIVIQNWQVPGRFTEFPTDDKWYIYKIGYFFYFLLYGRGYDKYHESELSMYNENKQGIQISELSQDLLNSLLQKKYEKRIDWKNLYDHKLFTQYINCPFLYLDYFESQNIDIKFVKKVKNEFLKQKNNINDKKQTQNIQDGPIEIHKTVFTTNYNKELFTQVYENNKDLYNLEMKVKKQREKIFDKAKNIHLAYNIYSQEGIDLDLIENKNSEFLSIIKFLQYLIIKVANRQAQEIQKTVKKKIQKSQKQNILPLIRNVIIFQKFLKKYNDMICNYTNISEEQIKENKIEQTLQEFKQKIEKSIEQGNLQDPIYQIQQQINEMQSFNTQEIQVEGLEKKSKEYLDLLEKQIYLLMRIYNQDQNQKSAEYSLIQEKYLDKYTQEFFDSLINY